MFSFLLNKRQMPGKVRFPPTPFCCYPHLATWLAICQTIAQRRVLSLGIDRPAFGRHVNNTLVDIKRLAERIRSNGYAKPIDVL